MKGIYKITNTINNKVYIGQTIDIDCRWKRHKNLLNNNKHINTHLQNSWNKYGEDNFKFEVIKECENNNELNKFERYYIEKYKSNNQKYGYNLTNGGEGYALNESVKNKISKSKRGQSSNLSEKEVTEIKMLLYCLMDRKEISKIFNVSEKVITQISIGKSFAYIHTELNDKIHNLKQKLIQERNDYILELFDKGMKIKDIVNYTDYTLSIVEKCIYKYRNPAYETKKKYQKIYDDVFKLHSEGLNNEQISKKLNIGHSTVARYLKNETNPYKELPYKKINKELKDNIIDLYFNKNKSSTYISKKYNISTTTVLNTINNYKYVDTEVD